MKNQIPYNKQYIDLSDIKSVSSALKEKLITQGKFVKKFEKKVAKFVNSKFALSCINGTAGLDMAFKSINLKNGDNVIIPAVNFIAAYSMARKFNANIFLSDVHPLTGQMTEKNLLDCIQKNNLKKIKAIITMFLGGYPENISKFYQIKKKFKAVIIEDACHAFGAKYSNKGRKKISVGSCSHSDLSVFSFHPVKTITTGEGGIVTSNNKKLFKKMMLYRNHNIVREKNYWEYDVSDYGMNYRLSDINCALGLSQLKKIEKFISYRKKIFNLYKKLFNKTNSNVDLPFYSKNNHPSYHLFLISLKFKKKTKNKDSFIKYLNKRKIFPQFHYKPINLFSLSKSLKLKNNLIGAKYFYDNALSLPMFYKLKSSEVSKIVKTINNYF